VTLEFPPGIIWIRRHDVHAVERDEEPERTSNAVREEPRNVRTARAEEEISTRAWWNHGFDYGSRVLASASVRTVAVG